MSETPLKVTAPLGIDRLGADGLVAHKGRVATFYNRRGDVLQPWRDVDLSHKLAGGGFVASPVELARIGSAWLDDEYIAPATRATFWSPVALTNGKENPENYALGWRRKIWKIDGFGAVDNVNHGGVSKGSQCWLMVVPEGRIALAACMNALTDEFFDFADVARDLLPIFLSKARKAP